MKSSNKKIMPNKSDSLTNQSPISGVGVDHLVPVHYLHELPVADEIRLGVFLFLLRQKDFHSLEISLIL